MTLKIWILVYNYEPTEDFDTTASMNCYGQIR